jgi:hypothetical protein
MAGMEIAGSVDSDSAVDGVVEMMLDATQNCFEPLTADRLFDWHAALISHWQKWYVQNQGC